MIYHKLVSVKLRLEFSQTDFSLCSVTGSTEVAWEKSTQLPARHLMSQLETDNMRQYMLVFIVC